MRVEVVKLVWQDVSIGYEIKLLTPIALLHLHIIVAETIFSSDFVALGKMIYSLVLV